MDITKQIFTTKELVGMGYSRYEIIADAKHPKQDFCTTTPGGKKYKIDLQKYLAFRNKYRMAGR